MTDKQLKYMADRIKERRAALGFTQEKFSEAIELSASSYTKIENAFQQPSLDTLIKIAKQLDVSLDFLVFGADAEKSINTDVVNVILKNADKEKIRYAIDVMTRVVNEVEKHGE